MSELIRWDIPVGETQTSAWYEPASEPGKNTVLVLAHGAGATMQHRSMTNLAVQFRSRGLDVVRFDFLYRALDKGRPDPMPKLTQCFEAVVEMVRRELKPARLLMGGRSLGGRASSMMAAHGFECDGLLLLAYPLHPPGRPEKLRDAHLADIRAPVLCVNGTRDDLCRKDLMDTVVQKLPDTFTMHWIEGADHGFHMLKRSGRTDHEVLDEIGRVTEQWLASEK